METGQGPKQKQDHEPVNTPRLGEAEKGTLLRIARETLTEYLTSGSTPEYEFEDPGLVQEVAAFVTLFVGVGGSGIVPLVVPLVGGGGGGGVTGPSA